MLDVTNFTFLDAGYYWMRGIHTNIVELCSGMQLLRNSLIPSCFA